MRSLVVVEGEVAMESILHMPLRWCSPPTSHMVQFPGGTVLDDSPNSKTCNNSDATTRRVRMLCGSLQLIGSQHVSPNSGTL